VVVVVVVVMMKMAGGQLLDSHLLDNFGPSPYFGNRQL